MGEDEQTPLGVTIYDPEHEEFVRDFLRGHPPGGYLAGPAEDLVKRYFKMDKAKWFELFTHDCTVAFMRRFMRRDADVMESLKEAYRQLAGMLDWREEEPWVAVERAPAEAARKAAETLFNVYWKGLEVEGWRVREGETLHEGVKRGLDEELSDAGDAFRREFGRWYALEDVLNEYEREVRFRDRAALWFACELEVGAKLNLYGRTLRSCYPDHVLQHIISGDSAYVWLEEALWLIFLAVKMYDDGRRAGKWKGSYHCEDLLVWAMMWVEGMDPDEVDEKLRMEERYLEGLGRPDLLNAYRVATGVYDEGIFGRAFKPEHELTDGDLRVLAERRKASEEFFHKAIEKIGEMLEKDGFKMKLYAELPRP